MKSSTKATASNPQTADRRPVEVIKNAHSVAEQRAIGDRWADHKGPRMTLAETLAHAAKLQEEKETVNV